MKGFEEIVAAAQVGTRNAPPPRATELPLEGTERTVLLELGALGLMRRAGAVGVAATPLPASPPETLRVADAANVLDEAFDLKAESAVREWAEAAASRGFVAPPAALPMLVPRASKEAVLRPLLGERGRWLAGLMGIEVESPNEPLPDPSEWNALEPEARVRLVGELPEDDVPLFERALTDRRKEVREAAVERLVRIPNSPQARELHGSALRAVRVERGILRTALAVEPPSPEDLPPWLPRRTAWPGVGPNALALRDLLRLVPPSTWGRPPAEMLALAAKSDHKDDLFEGWGKAALRFDDGAWIDALLVCPDLPPGTNGGYADRASERAFDAELIPRLRGRTSGMMAAYGLLLLRERPFSATLSRAVVEAARRGEGQAFYVRDLGPRLHLSALPLLDERPTAEGPWAEVLDRWRKILDLRRRLLETLR